MYLSTHTANAGPGFSWGPARPWAWFLYSVYFAAPFWPKIGLFLPLITLLVFSRLPRFREALYLLVLVAAVGAYYILGAADIRPNPLSAERSLISTGVAILFILPFFFITPHRTRSAITALMLGVAVFVLFEGVFTIYNYPETAIRRYMMHPILGEEVHSTGQINATALAAFFLIAISRKLVFGWIAWLVVALVSIAFQNRTGMLLSVLLLIFLLLKRQTWNIWQKFFWITTITSVIYLTYFLLVEPIVANPLARLMSEGLQTERYEIQLEGLKMIIQGRHLFGGGQLSGTADTFWYHNIFIDAYRVAGILGLVLFVAVVLISFLNAVESRSIEVFSAWVCAFALVCTSVVMEGFLIEYLATFSVFSYALVARSFEGRARWLAHVKESGVKIAPRMV